MAFPVSPLGFLGSGQPNLYRISKSLRFSRDPTTQASYLYRTPHHEGSRKQFTWSGWYKNLNFRSNSQITSNAFFHTAPLGTGVNSASYIYLQDGRLVYWDWRVGAWGRVAQTTGAFRDPTAWYHFIVAVNYTAPLSSDRVAFYVNGVRADLDVSTTTYPNTGEETAFNDPSRPHYISDTGNNVPLNGYLTEVNYIDGQTLDPSNFGYFDTYSGVWVPRKYIGTYGTNGFYLNYSDTTSPYTLGYDFSYHPTPGSFPDPYWDSTMLLLHCNGSLSATNNTFVDDSVNRLTIVATPSATQGSESPFKLPVNVSYSIDYGGSVYLADGEYLQLPSNNALNLGTGDWTIEFWIKVQDNKNLIGILNIDFDQFEFDRQDTGNGSQYFVSIRNNFAPGGDKSLTSIASASNVRGRWEHVALVKSGTTGVLYVNGINVTNGGSADFSNTDINVTNFSYTPWIGRHATNGGTLASYFMRGWLSNFRITKSAVYTGNFIPSPTPLPAITNTSLLLNFASGGVVDSTGTNTVNLQNGARINTFVKQYNTGSLALSSATIAGSYGAFAWVYPSPTLNLNDTDFTIECWFRTSSFSPASPIISSAKYYTVGANGNWIVRINSSTQIGFFSFDGQSTQLGADFTVSTMSPNTWYHLAVIRYNGNVRLYLNGVHSSTGATAVSRTLNDGGNNGIYIGRTNQTGTYAGFNGEVADIRISRIARYSTDSTSFTPPTTQLPDTGNYVYFGPSQGLSVSTSTNYGTSNDSCFDVPTPYTDVNPRGNYPVMSPFNANDNTYVDRCGLRSRGYGGNAWYGASTTVGVRSGKWYWEDINVNGSTYIITGVTRVTTTGLDNNAQWHPGYNEQGGSNKSFGYYASNGHIQYNNTSTPYGNTWTAAGDVISHALDLDNKKYFVAKNGVWQGSGDPVGGANPAPGATTILTTYNGDYFQPAAGYYGGAICHHNYGQRPFLYQIPIGYKALCYTNLPATIIRKPGDFFSNTHYVGTGSTRTVTTSGLSGIPVKTLGTTIPDLIWIKGIANTSHVLIDTTRGATVSLSAQSTAGQTAEPAGLQAFLPTGFIVGPHNTYNALNANYSSWSWRKNRAAGFDIAQITKTASSNQTFLHQLGQKPAMMIVKAMSPQTGQNWGIFHQYGTSDGIAGQGGYFTFGTAGYTADTSVWNNTAPTNTQFTLGTFWSAGEYVAYLFAEIPGFSRFGVYWSNNLTNGPFCFCGFKPAFLMYKRADAADTVGWLIFDPSISQNKYNPATYYLSPANSNALTFGGTVDITSNGFKLNYAGADGNVASGRYVFAAFAESPFKIARAR